MPVDIGKGTSKMDMYCICRRHSKMPKHLKIQQKTVQCCICLKMSLCLTLDSVLFCSCEGYALAALGNWMLGAA